MTLDKSQEDSDRAILNSTTVKTVSEMIELCKSIENRITAIEEKIKDNVPSSPESIEDWFKSRGRSEW